MLYRVTLLSLVASAAGHGSMAYPRPRNAKPHAAFSPDASCIGQACFWYQVGCFNGCSNCTGVGKYLYPAKTDYPPGCELAEPTNNDPATRSWDPHGESEMGDFTKYNPWRSPGKAPVRDPCGALKGQFQNGKQQTAYSLCFRDTPLRASTVEDIYIYIYIHRGVCSSMSPGP